jgi:O-acetyl-ADP-ribose deacetylase (regulator of RNase III)
MEFSVVQGDIAAQQADALVNAAGTSLRMGSGVAGALRRAAGGPINEAAAALGPIDLGEVAVTDAFELDTDAVIHAAAMPHYGDGRATEDGIRAATRNTLAAAEARDSRSLVIPVLGTGAAGFDVARDICEELADYEAGPLGDVRVIASSDAEYETLQAVADEIRSV